MTMLPKELEDMGLAGKVMVREIPGFVPAWKPVNKGDFLLGRCVDYREVETKFTKTTGRMGKQLIFDTAVPGGFRMVWLGADLGMKLREAVGRVYSVTFDGEQEFPGRQPMKLYRVFEVVPAEGLLPEHIETLESRKTPTVLWDPVREH